MNLSDLIVLAKAGYSPKQVKELLEYVEASPKVKEATVEEAEAKEKEQKEEQKEQNGSAQHDSKDAAEIFEKILNE